MAVSAQTLRLLMEAGVEGEALLRIVESIEQGTKAKSANAERQARFRAKKKAESVTNNVTDNALLSVTPEPPLARVEDNLQLRDKPTEDKQERRRNGLADFRAVLAPHLGDERLEAFVVCRRAKNGGFTGHAARLFLADAESVSMLPADAADLCISRNWITVKPEYLRDRRQATATAPPSPIKPNGPVAALARMKERERYEREGGSGDPDAERLPGNDRQLRLVAGHIQAAVRGFHD